MKLFFILDKSDEIETLLNQLKKTDSLDEVIKVLSGIRNRSIFVALINELLNELSEERTERLNLERKIKEGIEIL